MSNNKGRCHKTQPSLTQRGKAQTRVPQPKHAYMYTRHNYSRHATQHNAHKHVAQTYQNTHCHCHCMSHTMTQNNVRKHTPQQHKRHVSYTRKPYHPRRNKFTNVECFYCMTKGHSSNVYFYRKLHLQLLPSDYFKTNKPRPRNVKVQRNVYILFYRCA